MKAKTMKIFDKSKPETDFFGVKIQVTRNRSVYVSKGDNKLFCVETKKEAQIEVDNVNRYISENPDLESRLNSDKSIQVVTF